MTGTLYWQIGLAAQSLNDFGKKIDICKTVYELLCKMIHCLMHKTPFTIQLQCFIESVIKLMQLTNDLIPLNMCVFCILWICRGFCLFYWAFVSQASTVITTNLHFYYINASIRCLQQECSQKGDSGCASEKLGVPHLLSD